MNKLPEHFWKIEKTFILNKELDYKKWMFTLNRNIQNGGLDIKTEVEFIDVGGLYTYTVNVFDNLNVTYVTVVTKSEMECITIFIDDGIATLHNITYDGKCAQEGLPRTGAGTKLLRFALNLILKFQEKYKLKRIVLSDHSYIPFGDKNKTGNILKLARLRLITQGEPWYSSFGFKPYDSLKQKPSKELLNLMDKNNQILKTLKTKSVDINKVMNKTKNVNGKDINNIVIKNPLLKDFVSVLSDRLDKYHDFLVNFLEEVYRQGPGALLTDFYNKPFYLDI